MRIPYSDEENYPGEFELWQANCRRSLHGQRGQVALRELEAALLALPSKRLIAGELDNGADCCAIGAMVRHRGIDPKAMEAKHDIEYEMDDVGVEMGVPRLVAWKIVEVNDYSLSHLTPEQRYSDVLAWVRRHLTAEVAA